MEYPFQQYMYRTLEYLRGITPDECRGLRAIGVRHTNQLLHHLNLEIDRAKVERKTGIPAPRLLQLARQCGLLEISGMDRHRNVIHRLGIESLQSLKRETPERLHQRVVEAIGLAGAPSLSMVQYWISQARAIDVLEVEGDLAEARKRERIIT